MVVGMMTAVGFAAVYLASQKVPEFSTSSLAYALFFFAVFLAAHLVVPGDPAATPTRTSFRSAASSRRSG